MMKNQFVKQVNIEVSVLTADKLNKQNHLILVNDGLKINKNYTDFCAMFCEFIVNIFTPMEDVEIDPSHFLVIHLVDCYADDVNYLSIKGENINVEWLSAMIKYYIFSIAKESFDNQILPEDAKLIKDDIPIVEGYARKFRVKNKGRKFNQPISLRCGSLELVMREQWQYETQISRVSHPHEPIVGYVIAPDWMSKTFCMLDSKNGNKSKPINYGKSKYTIEEIDAAYHSREIYDVELEEMISEYANHGDLELTDIVLHDEHVRQQSMRDAEIYELTSYSQEEISNVV